MTLGGSCYFYTHFGAANSIILSKTLITHRSSLKGVCEDAKPEGQIAAGS